MMKILGILLIAGCLLTGLISYNALAVPHYDLDPVSVLASLLNITIQSLGYVSGVLSVVLLILGVSILR
ncbi:hypothetical protein KFU94_58405 [Chloroflexi bacterium TSY]|nr:hypothetical protein [Chloroflexi bacterium TSY]